MTPFRYTVDDEVLHVFAAGTKRHRQELLRIFDFLAREPLTEGDSTQADQIHILDVERLH
ncbi:MAG: hypothetical protein EXS31_03280 [Pedosphaera sp.]|nr:hypothetical protein [Pedosphaera sp.]